jgi:hypothetical protein
VQWPAWAREGAEEALAEELPHSRSCFAEPLAPADVRRVLAWRDKAAREFGAAHGPSEPFALEQTEPVDALLVDAPALRVAAEDDIAGSSVEGRSEL